MRYARLIGARGTSAVGYLGLFVAATILCLVVVKGLQATADASKAAETRYLQRVAGETGAPR